VFMADGMIIEDGPAKDVLLNSTHERSLAFFKELQRA
jgi:ABC-type polar amino acid transport system ATPase subunit